MNHIETQRPLSGSELNHNGNAGHIRLLTVVPTDLQALLEQLEAGANSEEQTEAQTK
jgi:hypothetical protein